MRSFSFTVALSAALATSAFAGGTVTDVRINEVDADQTGTDSVEFFELAGPANQDLSDLFVVLFNGSNDTEYLTFDLASETMPADGFYVVGAATVANVDNSAGFPATNAIQNGQDAIALYHDTSGVLTSADFDGLVAGTLPAGAVLIDALVYDTNDGDDAVLLAALGITGPQVNEDDGTDSTTDSNQRCPDGGAAFDTASYVQAPPTPGAPNTCAAPSAWTDLGSALGGVNGDPLFVGTGDLTDGSANSADLSNAAGSAMSGLFIGIDPNTPMSFKGGTLVPVPVFQVVFATTSPTGEISTGFIWPNAGVSGFNLYAQWAITDAAAPQGFALSNAIQGTTP